MHFAGEMAVQFALTTGEPSFTEPLTNFSEPPEAIFCSHQKDALWAMFPRDFYLWKTDKSNKMLGRMHLVFEGCKAALKESNYVCLMEGQGNSRVEQDERLPASLG